MNELKETHQIHVVGSYMEGIEGTDGTASFKELCNYVFDIFGETPYEVSYLAPLSDDYGIYLVAIIDYKPSTLSDAQRLALECYR